jgi:hypothetical protein
VTSDKRDRRDDRDAALDHLLRRTLRANTASPDMCLDAETLAAWTDGVLPAGERAVVEAHAAGCARCQALLAAMVRTELSAAAPQPWWRRRRTLGWLVPLTATATAAVVWLLVSPGSPRREAETAATSTPAKPSLAAPRAADELMASPSAAGRPPQLEHQDTKKSEQKMLASAETRDRRKENAPAEQGRQAPASAAAPPPARSADASSLMAKVARLADSTSIEIVSPDSSSRWRVNVAGAGDVVQHSTDGGSTWIDQSIGISAQLTAGASPSASVCWLVGRAGTVLLSIDGRTWQRRSFPAITDLVAVRATDLKTATVTGADGRTFTTKDGGLTWDPAPLQESPAAPF